MDATLHPTVIAAAIAAVSAIAGALLADRVKRAAARNDLAARQYEGWDKYTGHLMRRVSDLEDEIRREHDECDRRMESLEEEMRRRDEICQARINALEARLSAR